MGKVLIIGLLFAFTQSFGQSLHPNYKAQINTNLKNTNQLGKEVIEHKTQENTTISAPKYKKQKASIRLEDQEGIIKHKNYKQHATHNKE